jgi:Sulfotransferase family
MSDRPRCVQILSTKSSGSSVLQSLLCDFGGGRHVRHTRHGEFETLYWTKAASVLGLSQVRLPDSEVPIPAASALRDLVNLLSDNVPGFRPPADNRQLIFNGWKALCLAHTPVYVEKSPHHLHQWSCLQLMLEAIEQLPEVDFRFVGLIRNPMDVLYSAWNRWRVTPEAFQHHWRTACENLERFRVVTGMRLIVVRYEDLSDGGETSSLLLNRLGMQARPGANRHIHGQSRRRWATDPGFGFRLDSKVSEVAGRFGYAPEELENHPNPTWPIRRTMSRLYHRSVSQPLAFVKKNLRRRVSGART